MPLEPEEVQQNPAVAAFVAELRHWREVAGFSQKALAKLVGYTPSYVNKVEHGTVLASRAFAESADQHLHAGRSLIRRWKDMHDALAEMSADKPRHDEPAADDPQSAPGPDLVVEHELAELTLRDGMYQTRIRRQLRNTGTQPVTQYLIRIAVDSYPGDPERSNQLYREDPLRGGGGGGGGGGVGSVGVGGMGWWGMWGYVVWCVWGWGGRCRHNGRCQLSVEGGGCRGG